MNTQTQPDLHTVAFSPAEPRGFPSPSRWPSCES
jgi:hypothetical protein